MVAHWLDLPHRDTNEDLARLKVRPETTDLLDHYRALCILRTDFRMSPSQSKRSPSYHFIYISEEASAGEVVACPHRKGGRKRGPFSAPPSAPVSLHRTQSNRSHLSPPKLYLFRHQ